MISFAPGLFSTTTGCFHLSDSCWPMLRTSTSAGPPAVYGTMMRTALVGHACAWTTSGCASATMDNNDSTSFSMGRLLWNRQRGSTPRGEGNGSRTEHGSDTEIGTLD